MARSLPTRIAVALATGAAASMLVAASASATEPGGPPAGPPLPGGVTPVTIPPVPVGGQTTPARVVRRARVVPRRVRRGRKATLRISLSTPSRLQVVISRSRNGQRVRALNIPAKGNSLSVRLPARAHGRSLRPGRYRISIVAIDALGTRARPVVRTLIVRRGARR